ncbi:AAA family ATPase [Actinomadura hibisca]|uniref:AAA family ATPase n=1 Tax=Actinomadura hibisca TaxID=68565 RepID=UPI00082BE9A0|nr:SMC family ATPase [Actinomadura hibisca]
MRLHRLEVTAFGPFPATEEIDFEALSDAGLFLIQGQTGAGKTSVLDAVCFALYGAVPGVRNDAKGLRSDHAAPGTAPRVVLEVTLRGRRLRITRSPAWERPKLRGTGTTTENAKVVLEEHDGDWTGLSTRIDEASDLVGGLLGMNKDQFCQVAMLPQGAFAGFLRADAEERRKVLERLFAAEIFTRVEKWLADHRAEAHRKAEALSRGAEAVAGRIAETSGAALPEDAPISFLPAWAAELTGNHEAISAQADALSSEVAADLAAAKAALEHGRALADRQAQHADALRRRDVLAERAEEKMRISSRLEAAERAGRVAGLIRQTRRHAENAERARRYADYTRSLVNALVPPGAAEDVLAKEERDRRNEIATLEGRRADAERLRRHDADRASLAEERSTLEPRRDDLAVRLTALPDQVKQRAQELEAARLAAAARPGARAAVAEAERRLTAGRRRETVERLLVQAEDAHRAATDTAQEARDRAQTLRQERLDGMAAVLAAELVAGEPCLVCGSREHPEPLATLAIVPDQDELDRAQAEADRAQEAREKAAKQVTELRTEHEHLLATTGDTTVEALTDDLDTAHSALATAEAHADEAARLETALQQAERELDRARADHDDVARRLTEIQTRDAELSAEQRRLTAELDRARGDDPSLDARVARLTKEADALQDAVEAGKAAATAAQTLAESREAEAVQLDEQAFRSADEALAAELDDEDQGPLRDKVRWFDKEDAIVRDLLGNRDLTAAAAEPAPDPAALQGALELAEAAHTAAASAADQARRRYGRLTELRADLRTAVDTWHPAAEEYRVAERMAGLTSGKSSANRRSMSLSAYVLAARLEQVVAAANERLARMSAGRYELAHTIDKAAGVRKKGAGGLGLRVVDSWTGLDRDPATLSGGESFITSLALALGLADVVTAEAGGAEINTLFVDEGFGTLDEQSLDEVMDVLDGLRDGGRAVGIVSHVAELRARIPAQLRLTKGRTGSTARVWT